MNNHIGVLLSAGCAAMFVVACASGLADAPEHQGDASSMVNWQSPLRVASGNAERGPWRMNRSQWDFVDDATVAINAEGFTGVAWADHTKQDILFQLYNPDGEPILDDPVNVTRSGDIFSWLPRMILSDGDNAADLRVDMLWQEIIFSGGSHGGEILYSQSTNGGRSFSPPKTLSNSTAGAGKGRLTAQSWHNGSYDMVRFNEQTIVAAWTEYEGNLWVSRSDDNGRSFSQPLHIAGASEEDPARGPSLATGVDETVHLVWTVGEDSAADIRHAMSDDAGRSFRDPRMVGRGSGHADAPKIAVDSQGTVHLVYAESDDGRHGRYRLRYARMVVGEREFGSPRDLVVPQDASTASVHFPMLRIDSSDRLFVTWEQYPSPRGRPLGLGYVVSPDGGDSFSSPRLVPGSDDRRLGFNGSQQGLLASKLAVNADGHVAVVSSTYNNGRHSRITLYRGRVVD